MNKKLKKALVSLAVVPCMLFSVTGCIKDNNPPDTGLTATQKNEAYTSLKTLTAQRKFIDASSTAFEMGVNVDIGNELSLASSGLNAAGKQSVEDALEAVGAKTGYNNLFGIKMLAESGYKANNTGYLRATNEFSGMMAAIMGGDSFKVVDTEVTRGNGTGSATTYTTYQKSTMYEWGLKEGTEDTYEWKEDESSVELGASLVDNKYAINTYKSMFNDDDMNDVVSPALEFITENNSYTEFVSNFDDFANKMIGEYGEMSGGLPSIPATAVANADLTLTDGVYTLTANIAIDNFIIPANAATEEPEYTVDMDVDMTIKFDNDSVDLIDMGIEMSQESSISTHEFVEQYPDSDILREELEANGNADAIAENTTGTADSKMMVSMGININTKDTFDESIMGNDTTILEEQIAEYTGTGVGGTIENRVPEIEYVIGNHELFVFDDLEDNETAWGEVYPTITAEQLGIDGATIKFYSDAAMTQEITDTTLIPSYDHTVYVKIVSLPENTSLVLIERHDVENDYSYASSPLIYAINEPYLIYTGDYETITSVTNNGTAVANYTNGITLTAGINHIVISYTSNWVEE